MKSQVTPKAHTQGKQRVFVGLSGGVDSAVSAALLVRAGYDVTGVFIKVWQPEWIECTWRDDRRDAMRVAAQLDIPFVTLDLEKEYKQGVIDYMIAEYALGRTPNPDVMCNREVKFGAFWKWAEGQGGGFVATGHYARKGENGERRTEKAEKKEKGERRKEENRENGERRTQNAEEQNNKRELIAGTDKNKDQSYFLWTLNQDDLGHVLFPVGHLAKPEARKLAAKFKLPNATKKDSQGLCFIGKLDIKEFLTHYIEAKPGNVLDEKGVVIGTHPGSLLFTIGERHGFTITAKTPNDSAYYVVSKNTDQNTITVSNRLEQDDSIKTSTCTISRTNWVGTIPAIGQKLQARSRYRQPLQEIEIIAVNDTKATVAFAKAQDTLTPGQSLVIYDGEVCVGGGVIE